tara:strand:+ start:244 stop:438 length:195 start_codon:yes stop_codon:yes gene_type:complete
MDLSDERFHKRVIRWKTLIKDGYDPKVVMVEAQKQGMHRLAHRAYCRVRLQKEIDAAEKTKGEK